MFEAEVMIIVKNAIDKSKYELGIRKAWLAEEKKIKWLPVVTKIKHS